MGLPEFRPSSGNNPEAVSGEITTESKKAPEISLGQPKVEVDQSVFDEAQLTDTGRWVREEAAKAKANPPEKKPHLELVPPIEEGRSLQEAPEVAAWAQQEAVDKAGELKRQEETARVSDLVVLVGRLRNKRAQLIERVKRTDQPMRKAIEALAKIGLFKDTFEAMRASDAQREKLEQSLDATEQEIREAEMSIERIATAQEARMQKQTKEIAQGASSSDQALIEKWFYNHSTEGGAVSEVAQEEWEAIERGVMDWKIIAGMKGFDEKDKAHIDQWFQNSDTFVDEVNADLDEMAKEDTTVTVERDAWRKNELPPDTKEAMSARLATLREETAVLERERNQLEDKIRKTFGGGQDRPAHFHERIRFDERLRNKYLGGWVRKLFGNRGSGAETFLTLEPELQKKEAQLAINYEAIRRSELALKDPRAAVREAAVREIARVEARVIEKRKTPWPAGIPGSMRRAA